MSEEPVYDPIEQHSIQGSRNTYAAELHAQ